VLNEPNHFFFADWIGAYRPAGYRSLLQFSGLKVFSNGVDLKIAHITDIHSNDFITKSECLDAMDNFKIILADIKSRGITKIVLTGDYGDPNDFNALLMMVKSFNLEYEYILGNHDDFDHYRNNDDLGNRSKPSGIFFSQTTEDAVFIFLDTRLHSLDTTQLNYMDNICREVGERKIIIFMHHPVLDCGDTFMDLNFPLSNRDEAAARLYKLGKKVVIFSGHYHTNHFIEKNNIKQYVTMSTLFQLKKNTDSIEINSFDFGYRIIDIGCSIETDIVQFSN